MLFLSVHYNYYRFAIPITCIYVGGVSEHETLGNVECYDPETDRWVVDVIPQMRYRRSGVGVAVLQGLLFAIGGYLEGKTSTDAVECYNPRTKRYVLFLMLSPTLSMSPPLSLSQIFMVCSMINCLNSNLERVPLSQMDTASLNQLCSIL